MSSLIFSARTKKQANPPSPRPVFVLKKDFWDDFGHKVHFYLSYIDVKGKEISIGEVKILQRMSRGREPIVLSKDTQLPELFSELGEEFVSIGQEDS